MVRLIVSLILGLGLFTIPIPWGNSWTVLMDVLVKYATKGYPTMVGYYCLILIWLGVMAPMKATKTSTALRFARVVGGVLALLLVFGMAPGWLSDSRVGGLMWGVLVASVGVIIPFGAAALSLLSSYGALELVGTLMRPIMRPCFKLPGRAALDDLTSWLGSYSVGLYLTRRLIDEGYYNRKEGFIIVTCFSTVSIGFVGVICSTLDLLSLFPLVMGTYFVVVYLLAAILARTWPARRASVDYIGEARPEEPLHGSLLRESWDRALTQARQAPGMASVAWRGLKDGIQLACSLLGTILSVGTGALLLAHYTPIFAILGAPLVPVYELLGLPDARLLGQASVAGITEMYIPALLVKGASLPARFFIAVLSISQLVFFSSVAPMMLEMFGDLPVKIEHLFGLFFLRTAILIPLLAGLTHLYIHLGWLG